MTGTVSPSTHHRGEHAERVLITGGAAGIGAAIAQRCRDEGYEPVVIDRQVEGIAGAIQADLSDAAQVRRALDEALAGGPITRLVNNVGVVCPADAASQTLEEFDLAVSLNLRCAFLCMQGLLPGMKAAGFGRIVNMASRAALGKELRTAYAATKAGLLGMTRVWALELGPLGITANAIGPGPIRTELFDRANPPDAPRTRAIIESVPVRRVGTPDDVAHAAAYLLDARSGFVTGQVLYVCGGMTVGVAGV
ncbi:MAG: 3-oxoacyl-[acyl-carrier-protein] reductase FabG [Paracidovorax wautersii]|uniref:3-oxoacyl-[acyl-carrier-protein] reductase FabG n=1 Tax=Paracidovorax wautersii TaxID=1177982 RepID=A0A7V8FPU9_9BURK|nr:MAG: 3-oxoacyl-[acyl-carrier-protein] reductase FabG [Paracidovorax wautersii]